MIDYGSARRLARAGGATSLLTGGLFLLAACAAQQAPQSVPEMVPMAQPQDLASLPPPEPPAAEMMQELELEPPAEMPPPAPEPPPMPTDAQSLRAAYGMPAFIRREPDSELWRYDGMGCTAFFFLYLDGGTYRVRHTETTPRGQDMPADPECLRSLIAPAEGVSVSGGMS